MATQIEELMQDMDRQLNQIVQPTQVQVPVMVGAMPDHLPERLNFRHEALIDFMVANPMMTQQDIAKHFGYLQSYLSKLINSGLFRAKLAERRMEVFSVAAQTNREKLEELSSVVLDRLLVKVEVEQDTARLAKVAELALKAAGYGEPARQPAASVTQQNVYFLQPVQREILARAREESSKRFVEPELIQTQDAATAE